MHNILTFEDLGLAKTCGLALACCVSHPKDEGKTAFLTPVSAAQLSSTDTDQTSSQV